MKTILKAFLVLMVELFSLGAQSQEYERFPLLRERIVQAKLFEIRRSLNLDQATMQHFRPIYIQYEKELAKVNISNQIRLMNVNHENLTSEEAEKLLMVQFENAKRFIEIRERYYNRFKTVLTPQQIVKLYQTEAQIRLKVMQELKRRRMGRFN